MSVLFEHFEHIQQYRDNIDNLDNFGHNNHDMKCLYRYISSLNYWTKTFCQKVFHHQEPIFHMECYIMIPRSTAFYSVYILPLAKSLIVTDMQTSFSNHPKTGGKGGGGGLHIVCMALMEQRQRRFKV